MTMTPVSDVKLVSKRPYLLRAFHEWIVDNQLTPQIIVDAEIENVEVPQQYVEENRITLNISPGSVVGLVLANDMVSFSARFEGRPYSIYLPISSVLAIFARENGQGIIFPEEEGEPAPPKKSIAKKPVLRLVK